MFELENNDVLIKIMESNTVRTPVKIVYFNGEKIFNIEFIKSDLIGNNYSNQNGLCILLETTYENSMVNTKSIQKFVYNSPFEYTVLALLKTEQQGYLTKTKTIYKVSKSEIQYKREILIHYADTGDQKIITEGNGFYRVEYMPNYNQQLGIGDFTPLLPFKSGKTFNWNQPINYSYVETIIPMEKNIQPIERKGEITGEFNIKINLKNKTQYKITDNEKIEAFEFEHKYNLKTKERHKDNAHQDFIDFIKNEVETKSKGIIAYAGIPLICKMEEENKNIMESYGQPIINQMSMTFSLQIEKNRTQIKPKMISEKELFQSFNQLESDF